jgi:ribosomal protein S18 acetylase RimI-like enzyme
LKALDSDEHLDWTQTAGIQILECHSEEEVRALYPIMHQLRNSLSLKEYLARVARARNDGYRLFYANFSERISGTIGLRIQNDLCWGHNLYVDDLVVDETLRCLRIGEALMRFAENLATSEKCDYVRLASGIDRKRVHRFYERLGYRKTSFTFALKV